MPKYLVQANYLEDGLKGLLKEGGTGRRDAVERLVASVGGTVDTFYFAFGERDLFAIVDLPDNASAAGLSMTVNASGMVAVSITVLLTPEEIDAAAKATVSYRAPGA